MKHVASMEKLLLEFLDYLEIEKGRSLTTRRNYEFYLRRFLNWAKEQGAAKPQQIDDDLVRGYRLWLNRLTTNNKLLRRNTQNYHLIALRVFLKYLAKRDVKTLTPEKIELAKQPERQVEFLEGGDLERLLEAPLHETQNMKHGALKVSPAKRGTPSMLHASCYMLHVLRDKAILELFFSTGLRVSELANLTREQVNLTKDEFTVRGKGAKLRIVFLSEQAKHWLKQYLNKRSDTSLSLFVRHDRASKRNQDLKPLTPRSIERLIQHYARAAGITKKVTPHTLRHSFATDLLKNGADIRSVQAMLGHSSITTTQIYTHLTNQGLQEIHKAFHGRTRK